MCLAVRSPFLCGRMIPGFNPEFAGCHSKCAVQIQRLDSRSASCGEADKPCAVNAPGKMCIPIVCAWIEERRCTPCVWVHRFCVCPFGLVAQPAREPEVLFHIFPAEHLGCDVFQGQGYTADYFLGLAVATTKPGLLSHPLAQSLADHGFACLSSATRGDW